MNHKHAHNMITFMIRQWTTQS